MFPLLKLSVFGQQKVNSSVKCTETVHARPGQFKFLIFLKNEKSKHDSTKLFVFIFS